MSLLSGFITAIFYNWHMNKIIIIIIMILFTINCGHNWLLFEPSAIVHDGVGLSTIPVESGGVWQESLDPDPVYDNFFLILFRKHKCSELMH